MTAAVLLMAYGGPNRLDQVEAYYTDIRRGRSPSPQLLEELISRYRAIGGGSPLSRIVEEQRVALQAELAERGQPIHVYAGMRHIEPRIGQAVEEMAADRVERFVAIALAPHKSSNAAGYRQAVDAALARLGAAAPSVVFVDSWHDQPGFIEALAATTMEALARFPDPTRVRVMFTAHSMPERLISEGDPYPGQLAETVALLGKRLGLTEYAFAFQSAGRTGEAWLGPDILAEIRRLASTGVRELVVRPVGFVADHLEVLYDIDVQAQAVAREVGVRLERAPSLNDDPIFIAGLADLATAGLAATEPEPASVSLRPPPETRPRMGQLITDRPSNRGGHPGAHAGGHAIGAVRPQGYVYGRAPMLVYWETTRACGLACKHCRATAMPDRDPAELSTEEGFALLDRVTGFGKPCPHLIFTGGDPLRRPDLETLVTAATARGIGTSLAPAVTHDMAFERLAALRAAGIQSMSLSIDGSDAARHDEFRGVPGTFDLTMKVVEWAHRLDLPLQINTLVTSETLPDLPAVYELMKTLGIMRWSLFFLISVGRGRGLREIGPVDSERLNHWLFDLSQDVTVPDRDDRGDALSTGRHQAHGRRGHGPGGDRGDVGGTRLRRPRWQWDHVHLL